MFLHLCLSTVATATGVTSRCGISITKMTNRIQKQEVASRSTVKTRTRNIDQADYCQRYALTFDSLERFVPSLLKRKCHCELNVFAVDNFNAIRRSWTPMRFAHIKLSDEIRRPRTRLAATTDIHRSHGREWLISDLIGIYPTTCTVPKINVCSIGGPRERREVHISMPHT